MIRVLVCGSRNWDRYDSVRRELAARREAIEVVIDGAARGADTYANRAARELGLPFLRISANWKKYGRGAGPKRNQQMLEEGRPDLVLAFHRDPALGVGTADMVRRAKSAGIPVVVFNH